MTLKDWLELNNLTHEEFADMCGCTRTAVTRWVTGSRMPSPKWLKVIERKTQGQVTLLRGVLNSDRERAYISFYRQGLTICAAAKRLRVHRNTLSRYFSGQADTPPEIVSRIYKLAGLE